jgi:glycosyltransferase involved in cell wall biosynthesis
MKLSIITINYNNATGLEKTIQSVINQTFTDYEYIIIDGGSTDGSLDVIKKYSDHIMTWVSEPDKGIYNAMNKGTQMATGEYLNYMNSGDAFVDNNVLKDITSLNSEADIVTGCHQPNGLRNIGKDGITMLQLYKWAIDHQASFINRNLCLRHPYDEKYKIVSDWKFFIECLVFDNCTFQFTEREVVNVEKGGISESAHDLDTTERKMALQELFPPRVLQDYERFASADSPILQLTPELNKTVGIQNVVYKFAELLLRIKKCFNVMLKI